MIQTWTGEESFFFWTGLLLSQFASPEEVVSEFFPEGATLRRRGDGNGCPFPRYLFLFFLGVFFFFLVKVGPFGSSQEDSPGIDVVALPTFDWQRALHRCCSF